MFSFALPGVANARHDTGARIRAGRFRRKPAQGLVGVSRRSSFLAANIAVVDGCNIDPTEVRDPAQIRRQLSRIVESSQFRAAGRLRDFLTYIVLETLEGRAQCIKEYTIGTEVYRRSALFNPKLDSIVRVEAVKLRARLEEYYSQRRAPDELVICIPKGGYVPEFRNRPDLPDQGRACADQTAELCDLGSFSLLRRTPAAIVHATRCFVLARNANPREARAHIGLADALVASLDIEAAPPGEVLVELKQSVMEGLRLNETSATGHVFASLYRATKEGTSAARQPKSACTPPRTAQRHGPFLGCGTSLRGGNARRRHRTYASSRPPRAALHSIPGLPGTSALLRRPQPGGAQRPHGSDHSRSDSGCRRHVDYVGLLELGRHDEAIIRMRAIELSETSATVSCTSYVLTARRIEEAEFNFNRLMTTPPHGYVSPLQLLAAVAGRPSKPAEAARQLALAQRENAWGLIWSGVDPRVKRVRSQT